MYSVTFLLNRFVECIEIQWWQPFKFYISMYFNDELRSMSMALRRSRTTFCWQGWMKIRSLRLIQFTYNHITLHNQYCWLALAQELKASTAASCCMMAWRVMWCDVMWKCGRFTWRKSGEPVRTSSNSMIGSVVDMPHKIVDDYKTSSWNQWCKGTRRHVNMSQSALLAHGPTLMRTCMDWSKQAISK